jgi:hypothetical protein
VGDEVVVYPGEIIPIDGECPCGDDAHAPSLFSYAMLRAVRSDRAEGRLVARISVIVSYRAAIGRPASGTADGAAAMLQLIMQINHAIFQCRFSVPQSVPILSAKRGAVRVRRFIWPVMIS